MIWRFFLGKNLSECLVESAFLVFLQYEQFYRFQFSKKTSRDAGKQK
jgi:hypothetical protein